MKKTSFLVGLFAITVFPAFSCWIAPPDFVVIAGASQDYFVRKDNVNMRMEVWSATDMNMTWSVVIPEYSSLFSEIKLSQNSDLIVHVVGNHRISSLEQECIQVFAREGKVLNYSLKEFIEDLEAIKTDQMMSISPKYYWIEKVNFVTNDRIGFTLGDGRDVVVSILENRIIMVR